MSVERKGCILYKQNLSVFMVISGSECYNLQMMFMLRKLLKFVENFPPFTIGNWSEAFTIECHSSSQFSVFPQTRHLYWSSGVLGPGERLLSSSFTGSLGEMRKLQTRPPGHSRQWRSCVRPNFTRATSRSLSSTPASTLSQNQCCQFSKYYIVVHE